MLSRDSGIAVGELSQAMKDHAVWRVVVLTSLPRMLKDDDDDDGDDDF